MASEPGPRGSILGHRVERREDQKFLTTGGRYTADLALDVDSALHATYVRSTFAHARLDGIDTSEALAMPGVVAVLTAADVDLTPSPPPVPRLGLGMAQPYLATDTVRFVGEPVAVVLSETSSAGVDAAEAVIVDYDQRPAVIGPEAALTDEVVLHDAAGTNVALRLGDGGDDDLFAGCEVVVRQRVVNQRLAPCPLEPRSTIASWDGDRLTTWSSTQSPHGVKELLATTLDLGPDQVRVVAPDVGGGFGAKIGNQPDEVLLAWIARRFERTVVWTETRSESMVALGHGRGQVQHVTIGGSGDGVIGAYRLEVTQDAGAYPRMGSTLPYLTRMMAAGVYAIDRVHCTATSVVTTTTPTVAYRGAGRPEATAAVERAVDLFAAEIGLDPAEVRRRNLIPSDAFPHTTAVGTTYDSGDYRGALDRALDAAGYDELRAEQRRRRADGDPVALGIGLSTYVEITGGVAGDEFGAVQVLPDGKVRAWSGSSSHGQGHVTTFAMLVADQLGVPITDVEVIQSDTDQVRFGGGTMGSRSVQHGGLAVHRAASEVVERARHLAADLLEANPADIVLDKDARRFHVAGTPTVSRSWIEVVAAAGEGGLRAETELTPEGPTFPFGAHVAVVEVDTETGDVRLRRLVAVDDAGTIVNPLLADGQIHGGLAQGAAQALLEEVAYDDDGNPVTSNLADYGMITAVELPRFERIAMETPTPRNELGAKGIGESGTIGSTPAVQNAVCDALAHLGVRHVDMPCTAERVWQAIQAAHRER